MFKKAWEYPNRLSRRRDIPKMFNARIHGTHQHGTNINISDEIQGDRIWAVRFAKVHKGVLCRRWMQTEETVGATLGKSEEEEEDVSQVLGYEAIKYAEIIDLKMAGASSKLIFVLGDS